MSRTGETGTGWDPPTPVGPAACPPLRRTRRFAPRASLPPHHRVPCHRHIAAGFTAAALPTNPAT
jgi:hypothetical protein